MTETPEPYETKPEAGAASTGQHSQMVFGVNLVNERAEYQEAKQVVGDALVKAFNDAPELLEAFSTLAAKSTFQITVASNQRSRIILPSR